MEAASVRALRPRRRRRWRPTWKAPVALVLYVGALYAGWSLVERTRAVAEPVEATKPATTVSRPANTPAGTDLTLANLTTRATRSVVGVGAGSGFVAWTANGLSLVLTTRPVGGWKTGPARSVQVTAGGTKHAGTLVRADPRTGLGLVRVEGELARPLWQRVAPVEARPGSRLAVAAPEGPKLFTVTEVHPGAIWGADPGTKGGQPVLDELGRLVGVTTGGRIVPIARACGTIRRC